MSPKKKMEEEASKSCPVESEVIISDLTNLLEKASISPPPEKEKEEEKEEKKEEKKNLQKKDKEKAHRVVVKTMERTKRKRITIVQGLDLFGKQHASHS